MRKRAKSDREAGLYPIDYELDRQRREQDAEQPRDHRLDLRAEQPHQRARRDQCGQRQREHEHQRSEYGRGLGRARCTTETLRRSAFLRAALGDGVVDHYVRAAEWEQEEFDRAVTDWEIARGFERA